MLALLFAGGWRGLFGVWQWDKPAWIGRLGCWFVPRIPYLKQHLWQSVLALLLAAGVGGKRGAMHPLPGWRQDND